MNDFIFADNASRTIDGGMGFDTVSYARLSGSITLSAFGAVRKSNGSVDQLIGVERIIAGSGGGDTIDASNFEDTSPVQIDLTSRTVLVVFSNLTGFKPPPLVFNVEGFENAIGTFFNDTLVGDNKANQIQGLSGDDVITGKGGADVITGGSGSDVFILSAMSDSTPSLPDKITDFQSEDTIDLRGIDSNPLTSRDDAFLWVGSSPSYRAIGPGRVGTVGSYLVGNVRDEFFFVQINGRLPLWGDVLL